MSCIYFIIYNILYLSLLCHVCSCLFYFCLLIHFTSPSLHSMSLVTALLFIHLAISVVKLSRLLSFLILQLIISVMVILTLFSFICIHQRQFPRSVHAWVPSWCTRAMGVASFWSHACTDEVFERLLLPAFTAK